MLEKMSDFFEARLDGYDEHMMTNIESANEFYPFTAKQLPTTENCHVLDLGCGSGILSIIALLLGAKDATAVDIDPNAVEIAVQNAKRNKIDLNTYRTFAGNVITDKALFQAISDKEYDVVVANIVADVIIGMKPVIPQLLKENGVFVTSGIIEERENDVICAYEKTGLTLINRQSQGGWVALTYIK